MRGSHPRAAPRDVRRDMAETQLAETQMDDPDDAGTIRRPAASPMGPGASITLSGPGGAVAGAPSPMHGGAVHTSELVEPALPASPLVDAPTQPVPVAGATTAANVHAAPAGNHPEPAVDDDASTVGEPSDDDDDAADFAGATMAAPYGDPDDPDSDSDATQAPEGYEATPPASPAPPPIAPDDDAQHSDADTDGFVTALSTPAPAAGGTPAPPTDAPPPHPERPEHPEHPECPEVERREHPDVERRDPEDVETADPNAAPDADPDAVERPRGSGSVDATAVSSGAIVGADVNASEAWRVAGAAYYDTQRTIPESEGGRAESSVEPAAAKPEEPRTEPEKPNPRAAYSADQLRRMNVGCEAAPAGMDFDREEARADVDAEVGTDADAEVGTVADAEVGTVADANADVDANADADAGSTPPRASAAAAPSTAREENPPPATSPAYIMDSESQELAGTPPAWSAYRYGEPSPAPATEETRDEKDETKTEEEPPARTARPRRAAAAAAAAAATTAAVSKKKKKDAPMKTPKPAPSEETRRASKRGANASDALASAPKRQNLRKTSGVDDAGVRVLLSAAYDAKQTSKLKAQAERLGGALAASASDFTHFVAAPPLVRSKNLLCALASGRPVVLPSWLEASSRAGRFAPTGDHLCRHPAFEKKHGFDLARTLDAARAAPVLSGVRAYVIPAGKGKRAGGKVGKTKAGADATKAGADATEAGADATKAGADATHAKAAREMLAAVLPAAGAEVATRSSKVRKATNDALGGDEWLIVAPVDADGGEIERLKVRGARVHGVEAVLSAVVRHKMDRTAHLVA